MSSIRYEGHGFNMGRFHPGWLEVFYGPMRSGKSGELIHRIDQFEYSGGLEWIAFKPDCDDRTPGKIATRSGSGENNIHAVHAVTLPSDNPYAVSDYIKKEHGLIVFDEAQFFNEGIVGLVNRLLNQKRNVVIGGLNLDFRAESFGFMDYFITHAELPKQLYASCTYNVEGNGNSICAGRALFTQRFIGGKLAPYDDDANKTEKKEDFLKGLGAAGDIAAGKGLDVTYESRCREHYVLPKKL